MSAPTVDDLVVVIPGIQGSSLARDGVEVWGLSAGTLIKALANLGRDIKRLQLPPGVGDDNPGDGVVATGLLGDLHVIPGVWSPIRGYIGLLDWLRSEFHLVDVDSMRSNRAGNLLAF